MSAASRPRTPLQDKHFLVNALFGAPEATRSKSQLDQLLQYYVTLIKTSPEVAATVVDPIDTLVKLIAEFKVQREAHSRGWWSQAHSSLTNVAKLRKALHRDPSSANRPDVLGNAPLMYTVKYGLVAATGVLLQSGANPDAPGTFGHRPLHRTVRGGEESDARLEVASLLIAAGATVDVLDDFSRTPLAYAVGGGNIPAVRLLVAAKASTGLVDCATGFSALHHAVMHRQPEALRVLIESGADLEATDKNGNSALTMARVLHRVDEQLMLLRAGSSLSIYRRLRRNAYAGSDKELRATIIRLLLLEKENSPHSAMCAAQPPNAGASTPSCSTLL